MSHALLPKSTTLNGYIAFHKNRRVEVYAYTLFEAREKAVALLKPKKPHDINIMLAEKGGAPVVHSTASL